MPPLNGITVLELGTSIAAPYATWVLGNLGADVVKLERPGKGDTAREWGSQTHDGTSLWFQSINADKRSITVDLRDADEVETLRRYIVAEVDVVVQNLKPGRVQMLGLDAASLTALKPELVYCNIGAFGRKGPLKEKPGYDPLMQAFGGLMTITGHPDQPPVRTGFSAIDMGTGMWAALGVVSALHQRSATGKGGEVDTALLETALGWSQIVASAPLNDGPVPSSYGSGVSGIVPYQAYECSDGWFVLGCGSDSLFARFCGAVQREDWLTDPKFAANPQRVKNRDELNAMLASLFIEHSRAHWAELLDAAGVPNSPIQDIAEVAAHPQTEALGMTQTLAGGLKLWAFPVSFDGERPNNTDIAPRLGADTDNVLDAYRTPNDT